jgi:hypothetical protein
MAKKIWYSSPLNFYWNELYSTQKKITPYLTDDQIYNALRMNILNAPVANSEDSEKNELILVGLEMWKEDYLKKFLHLFFKEKLLKDFLENMPLSDLDGIKKYLYENGENKKVVYTKTKSKVNCVSYCFGLHIPYETDGYAFMISIYEDEKLELFYSHGKNHGGLLDSFYLDLIKQNDKKSKTLTKIFRLAINTIAYMRCFPECVVDGVPKITIYRNESRTNNNKIFDISNKILEEDKSGKLRIPHFRKGHFRLLKSDYFTNKKGELVFIHETMVKGKAKTILTSDKIDKINNLNNSPYAEIYLK